MANIRKSKQHTAAPLHPTQQDLLISMAQPIPGPTKGKTSTKKTASSFNATQTKRLLNTIPFSRKGTKSTRVNRKEIHVNQPKPISMMEPRKEIHVNQPKPISMMEQPKSKST